MILSRTNGFSLIEILLVTIILAILAGMSIPQFSNSYSNLILKKTTEDIAYLMRYAQSRAVIKNRTTRLVFDEQFARYWLSQKINSDQDDVDDGQEASYKDVEGRWGRHFSIPQKIRVETKNSSFDFYPDGSIEKGQIKICPDDWDHLEKDVCRRIFTDLQRGAIQITDGI